MDVLFTDLRMESSKALKALDSGLRRSDEFILNQRFPNAVTAG